jgi:hypothetical protein
MGLKSPKNRPKTRNLTSHPQNEPWGSILGGPKSAKSVSPPKMTPKSRKIGVQNHGKIDPKSEIFKSYQVLRGVKIKNLKNKNNFILR